MHSPVSFDKHSLNTHSFDTSTLIKTVVSASTVSPSLLHILSRLFPVNIYPSFGFYHVGWFYLFQNVMRIDHALGFLYCILRQIFGRGVLLHIMFWRCVYVVTDEWLFHIFISEQYSLVRIHHDLSITWHTSGLVPTGGLLINKASMNSLMQILFFWQKYNFALSFLICHMG